MTIRLIMRLSAPMLDEERDDGVGGDDDLDSGGGV